MKEKQPEPEIADGLVQTLWLAFCSRIYPTPPDTDSPQYTAMRKCFFSGAMAIITAMDQVWESRDDLTVALVSQKVRDELQEFYDDIRKEVSQKIAERN